jgi:hypothetical protein
MARSRRGSAYRRVGLRAGGAVSSRETKLTRRSSTRALAITWWLVITMPGRMTNPLPLPDPVSIRAVDRFTRSMASFPPTAAGAFPLAFPFFRGGPWAGLRSTPGGSAIAGPVVPTTAKTSRDAIDTLTNCARDVPAAGVSLCVKIIAGLRIASRADGPND